MKNIKQSNFSRNFKSLLTKISPRLNTEVLYLLKYKKFINLSSPKTMDEKIQWLKLHTYLNNPLVTQCADKYKVRDYVQECGCGEILNELYFVWDSVDEIQWDELPDKFVLKWNFGCGQNYIVRDKSKESCENVKRILVEWYKSHGKFYLPYSEMQYKNIVPKLICEKLIETESGDLPIDYKLYCFNGTPDSVMLCVGRDQGHPRYYFFNRDWKFLPYNKVDKNLPEDFSLPKPKNIDMVFEYAEKLSKKIPFVRADFYLEDGKVIFGELTFTPSGGFDLDITAKTELFLGEKMKL